MPHTIVAQPQSLVMPAYNPLRWVLNSPNSNFQGFRYIIELKNGLDSLYKAAIAPRPIDGYGEIHLERILQNKVTWDFNTNSAYYLLDNSVFKYDLYVGEKYNYSWNYNRVELFNYTPPGGGNLCNSSPGHPLSGYTVLRGNTPNTFVNGDQIFINHSPGSIFSVLNGYHTVLESYQTDYIIIDVLNSTLASIFGTGMPCITPESGDVIYANETKTISFPEQIYGNNEIYNAAFGFRDWLSFSWSTYEMVNANPGDINKFITSCPNNFRVTPTQNIVFNTHKSNAEQTYLLVKTSGNEEYRKLLSPLNSTFNAEWLGIHVGIPFIGQGLGFTPAAGSTLPIIKPTTEWYEIELETVGVISETKRLYVDRRCPVYYNDTPYDGGDKPNHIFFLDRQGAWGSISFSLKRKDQTKVNRKSTGTDAYYTDDIGLPYYTYNTHAVLLNTYAVDIERSIELNTDFLTDSESAYFEELVSSPVTFLYCYDKSVESYNYIQVEIADDQVETKRKKNKALNRHTLKVNVVGNDKINI